MPDEQGQGLAYEGAAFTGPPGPQGYRGAGNVLTLPDGATEADYAAGWFRLAPDVGGFPGLRIRKIGRRVMFSGVTDASGPSIDPDQATGPGGILIPPGFGHILGQVGFPSASARIVDGEFGPDPRDLAVVFAAWTWNTVTSEVQACHINDSHSPNSQFVRTYGAIGSDLILVGWDGVAYDAHPSDQQ